MIFIMNFLFNKNAHYYNIGASSKNNIYKIFGLTIATPGGLVFNTSDLKGLVLSLGSYFKRKF